MAFLFWEALTPFLEEYYFWSSLLMALCDILCDLVPLCDPCLMMALFTGCDSRVTLSDILAESRVRHSGFLVSRLATIKQHPHHHHHQLLLASNMSYKVKGHVLQELFSLYYGLLILSNMYNEGWLLLSGLSQCKNDCVCAQDGTKQTLRARYVEKWIPPRPDFRFCGQYLLLRLCEVWFQTNIEHENAYPALGWWLIVFENNENLGQACLAFYWAWFDYDRGHGQLVVDHRVRCKGVSW